MGKVELRDYVEKPFSRGGWTGNIASMGARSVDAGSNAPVGESAVHVRLAAQKGNLVAYVRFQSGAGDDLDDAIAHGRAVVTDALAQFPR